MIERPNKYPDWATQDYLDPISGENNVVEPPVEKKEKGWSYRDKGIRNWFNWLGRYTRDWIQYVDERTPRNYPVTELPDATEGARIIFVEGLLGDIYPAYSDGTSWKKFNGDPVI
jgi:hypothetical protein